MAPELEILTISYAPDLALFDQLRRSVEEFTGPGVIHRVVVDDADVGLFARFAGDRCRVQAMKEVIPPTIVKIPHTKYWLNLRRPWPPVRGWVLQQVAKLAAVADSTADLVLMMDSDVTLIRPVDYDTFCRNGRPLFLRVPDGVHAGMQRHVVWQHVARQLLGLPSQPEPPYPDYVDSFNLWSPALVRELTQRMERHVRRSWSSSFASHLHVSEFILYGVFVDQVHGSDDFEVVDQMPSHNYWDERPLDRDEALKFARAVGETDVAMMISAKSPTATDIREEAWRAAVDAAGQLKPF